MKKKWWNQNPNKADVSPNFHTLDMYIFKRYQILYSTFLFERTVKKTRRILKLSHLTTWVVSLLSSLLATSLLSSPLDLITVTTRRRINPGWILMWSRSQVLLKMLRRIFDFKYRVSQK